MFEFVIATVVGAAGIVAYYTFLKKREGGARKSNNMADKKKVHYVWRREENRFTK